MSELVVQKAGADDYRRVIALYRELHVTDPEIDPEQGHAIYRQIIANSNLILFLGWIGEDAVASVYLNIIPNLTRGASPYAIIENVITQSALRNQGIGRRMMAHTLDHAWSAGCYKAMLQTGQTDPAVHAFYLACGFTRDAKTGYLAKPGD